ncbi:MAG: hypothetical protein LW818_09600 [Ignavibacteriae bacterium]|nr:hypothetical protein [Ignavibacteriota bacterium]
MKHIFGIVLFILCLPYVQDLRAQMRVLHISTIHIQQHSKKPLSSVRISSGNTGAMTDISGHVDLNISLSEQKISFSKAGYIGGSIIIPASKNDTSLTLILQPADQE